MLRYEGLFLATPQITQDETKDLESAIDKIIKSHEGHVISFEKWGKYRLAYPVKKNSYGVYFLTRFELPKGSTAIDDIKKLFIVKLHTIVMRNMFTRISETQPLTYQRPKSLEEAPARDVESFLKENKMTGILSSNDKARSAGNHSDPKKEFDSEDYMDDFE